MEEIADHVKCPKTAKDVVGNGNPLQYSCLENPMNRGAWRAAVQGLQRSWTEVAKQ